MPPAIRGSLHRSADRKVVGFRAAARKNDLRWCAADQRRHASASLVDGCFGRLPKRVHARRVPETGQERFADRLGYGGFDRRRGVVIEVDAHRCAILPSPLTISNERTRQDRKGSNILAGAMAGDSAHSGARRPEWRVSCGNGMSQSGRRRPPVIATPSRPQGRHRRGVLEVRRRARLRGTS